MVIRVVKIFKKKNNDVKSFLLLNSNISSVLRCLYDLQYFINPCWGEI